MLATSWRGRYFEKEKRKTKFFYIFIRQSTGYLYDTPIARAFVDSRVQTIYGKIDNCALIVSSLTSSFFFLFLMMRSRK